MKKFNILNHIAFICFLLVCTGCKEFLSMEPDSGRAVINTPEKLSQLLITAYPNAGYVVFAESMSDNVVDKGQGETDKTNQGAYEFAEIPTGSTDLDSPDMYWIECYRAISVANEALDIISKVSNPEKYQAQKGEALVARAYAHFMLVNFFSKVYNATTASTDLGIPYVTAPEKVVFEKYERKTVAYVYDMIEKDLLDGMALLTDGAYTVPKYHFNVAASKAFATRFYLMKRDYQKVIDHVDQVFSGTTITDNLRPWNTEMQSMSPAELYKTYSRATQNANLLLVETNSLIGRFMPTYRFGMSYAKSQEIFDSQRLISSGARWAFPLYYRGDNHYFVPKWDEYFVRASVNADIGDPYVMLPLFTTEEMLFNRAEAHVMMGNMDAALVDLNRYVSKRILNYNPTTHQVTRAKARAYFGGNSDQAALISTILSFKRVEFLQEGMRWFDMQRHGIPVTHKTISGSSIDVPATDPRRVLQIPQLALISGIEKNPR